MRDAVEREPGDPIAAVTHRDPYPYYAGLAKARFYRDEGLGLWIAADIATVRAVLHSDICRVRPPAEPVPKAIAETKVGDVFGRMMRFNDGTGHCPFKASLVARLRSLDPGAVADIAERLVGTMPAAPLTRFVLDLPVKTMASFLGVRDKDLGIVARWVHDLVGAISPLADCAAIVRGDDAVARLAEYFGGMPDPLRLFDTGEPKAILSNRIGILFQTCEATAALIGNSLLTLGDHPGVLDEVRRDPDRIPDLVAEVLEFDPPTQNTRRFVAADGVIAGMPLREGDAILVVLAAATRDPDIPNGGRFQLDRQQRTTLQFGTGAHACAAERLVPRIAETVVRKLVASDLDFENLRSRATYRRSVNVRLPLFDSLASC